MHFSRLIPDMIRHFYFGRSPLIRSDGLFVRDYVYVDDIVAGYMAAAEHTGPRGFSGEAFNFGLNNPHTALDVVRLIGNVMKTDIAPTILATAQHEIERQFLDSTKATSLLEWRPRVDLPDGLERTVRWYTNFFDHHPEYAPT